VSVLRRGSESISIEDDVPRAPKNPDAEADKKPKRKPSESKGAKKSPQKAAGRAPSASEAASSSNERGERGERASEAPESRDDDGDGNADGDEDRESDAGTREESAPESESSLEAEAGEPSEAPVEDIELDHDLPAKSEASPGSLTRFDPMAAYLREIQRHPLLTPEETHELAIKFIQSQDSTAAAQLVTSNLRLVVKIAYEYRRAYKNIMDLVQEGNIGLMQAVKRYDPYRGVKLSSYAAWWIRAYILRFILNNWRLVKLGTTQAQRKLFFNLRKKRAELQSMGIDPTDAEVAKRLNVPESDVAEMDVRLTSSEKSLDAPVGDAEGRSIAKVDMMPSAWEGPESLMADEELQSLLKEKLAEFRKTLAGKEKDLAIFDERLVADEPLTLQELGDRFGISRERVRQLEQRLTSKLREFLREEMGDAALVS
jgi:RNA polymerase sigma-32 factor